MATKKSCEQFLKPSKFGELVYKWFIPLFLVCVTAFSIGLVIGPWSDIKEKDSPPKFLTTYLPWACAAILLLTFVGVGYKHPWKMASSTVVLAMLMTVISFDSNWDKEKQDSWLKKWQVWLMLLPGLFVCVGFIGRGILAIRKKETSE